MASKSRLHGHDRSDGPDRGQGQKLLEQMRDVMHVKHYSFAPSRRIAIGWSGIFYSMPAGGGGAKKGNRKLEACATFGVTRASWAPRRWANF